MLWNKESARKPHGETKEINSHFKKIMPYWIFAALRVILTILPQTGYIHPDEYFQSIEVIAGDHFDIDVYKPWEFNVTFPVRTALIPQLTVGIPFSIINILSPYYSYFFGKFLKTPHVLIIVPRLMMCCLSFLSDYSLYKICCLYSQNYRVRLITYASSYVMIVYATRTFSNTIELILTSLLLYYVCKCMAYSEKVVLQSDYFAQRYDRAETIGERVKYYKLRASLPSHSLNHCLILATITVLGIFNRPTFLVFAFPPIFFWLQRGLGSRSVGLLDFHIRIFTFILCGIPTALFLILTDSFYFGYLTVGEIWNLKISMNNFVVTPVNFLKYNLNDKNLENHGIHPRFVHFLVNVPLLYNVLGFIGICTFGRMVYSGIRGRWLELPRIQSIEGLMTASFIVPIAALSLIPHQEPRFIIPALLPLVFLHAHTLGSGSKKSAVIYSKSNINNGNNSSNHISNRKKDKLTKLQYWWMIFNSLLTIFYGFAHQGGILPLASHLSKELRAKPHLTHVHLFTSYTYSLPTGLLQLRNTRRIYKSSEGHKYRLNQDFYLYEEGNKGITEVYEDIASKLEECENNWITKRIPYRLYYALPFSFIDEFEGYTLLNNSRSFQYRRIEAFYPHVTIEKLPALEKFSNCFLEANLEKCFTNFAENISSNIYQFFHSFGLLLLRIEVVQPEKLIS
ncbi:GPI mannosyltransferase 4 [Venturia canescens]|uniref:GPI mannosyltransferase 4 n=1 Tax=Venturia canescens TaxID=32260 RepID=UPI001C9CCE0B|nr:GPI mannosyltransferase 4 [Venturia canescens]